MKIVDSTTGKRVYKADKETTAELKKSDPIEREVEKGEHEEYSPMDPPNAYAEDTNLADYSYDNMSAAIKHLMDEHKEANEQIEKFEVALASYKHNNYVMVDVINEAFAKFFKFLDEDLLSHNVKEEKYLFPVLHQRLIEDGEHSNDKRPRTAIDLMEDDHNKFLQLGALTFNLLGLASRLQDERSRIFTLDVAYNNGRELTEMLKLHIYREDNKLFPLAQKLISESELSKIEKELLNH